MSDALTRGRWAPLFVGLVFALAWHGKVEAAQWTPYASLESLSYSEPVSVYATFNELEGSLNSGEVAFTHSQAELGLHRGPWTIALVSRYDWDLSFTNATAELLHAGENDLPVDANRIYPLGLQVNHLAASGLKVGYAWQATDTLQLEGAFTYLVGRQMMKGRVGGEIITDDVSSFAGNVDVNYRYSDDVLLDRIVSEPSGRGYTLDLKAQWQVTPKLSLAVAAYDVVSELHWKNAPYTEARVTSATIDFDSDGFINTTPLLMGFEGNEDFKQALRVRTATSVAYKLNERLSLSTQYSKQNSVEFIRLGFTWSGERETNWGFFYDTNAKAMLLSAEKHWFKLALGLDDLKRREANYAQLSLSLNILL